jgi:hypothetical protein
MIHLQDNAYKKVPTSIWRLLCIPWLEISAFSFSETCFAKFTKFVVKNTSLVLFHAKNILLLWSFQCSRKHSSPSVTKMCATTTDSVYRIQTPALHSINVTECGMDQTLSKFVHSGSSLTEHPTTVSRNKVIKPFNNRQLLANDSPQDDYLQFLQTQRTSQVPSGTYTKWAICQLFLQPFSRLDTHWIKSTSYLPFDNTWVVSQHE